MVDLDDRKRAVLRAVVEGYVRSAEPVGSEQTALFESLHVSSATIRGVMAGLEELGLLTHPHTSAGRVPTDLGYRVYVDMLLQQEPLPPADRQTVRRRLGSSADEPQSLSDQAARVLAALTHYASVVAPPGFADQAFQSLHLLPMGQRRVLAVIVTEAGALQGRPVELPVGVDVGDLDRLSRVISHRLSGVRIGELTRERLEQVVGEASRHHQVLQVIEAWLRRDLSRAGRGRLHVEGARHLLREPEFRTPEAATRLLDALEEETVLSQALQAAPENGVWISIGAENRPELRDCSLVAAAYRASSGLGGTVAIVGPTRMRYRRALAAVRYVAWRLTEVLAPAP